MISTVLAGTRGLSIDILALMSYYGEKEFFVKQHGAGERPPVFKTQIQSRSMRKWDKKIRALFSG